MDAFDGFPPGTVTAGKPEERTDGVVGLPFTITPYVGIAKRRIEAGERIEHGDVARYWPGIETYQMTGEPPADTPTVVGTREGHAT